MTKTPQSREFVTSIFLRALGPRCGLGPGIRVLWGRGDERSVAVRSLLRWRRTECCAIIVANKSTPNNNNEQQHQLHTQQQDFSEYPQPIRDLERPTTSPGGAATGNRGERRRRRRATIWERARRTFFLIPSRYYTSLSNPWFFQMFIWEKFL